MGVPCFKNKGAAQLHLFWFWLFGY